MEPRASTPDRRFEAVKILAKAGVPAGVMTAPMIAGLNDNEMESLLARAKAAGAQEAGYTMLRLPLEVSELFQEWLTAFAPDRAARVMRHVRDSHGGRDYDPSWGKRMRGQGPMADLLADRFARAAKRLGLNRRTHILRTDLFRPPPKPSNQLSLFDESESQ